MDHTLSARAQAVRMFLEGNSPGATEAQKASMKRRLAAFEEALRSESHAHDADSILAELEVEISNLSYSAPAEAFHLLLHVHAPGVHSEAHVPMQPRALNLQLTQLLDQVPRLGHSSPKTYVQLGEFLSVVFEKRDDHGASTVACLRLALFLAATAVNIRVSAALFRAAHESQSATQTYIDFLKAYREPTLILSPDFEICLPSWCRGASPNSIAEKINSFQPIPGSALTGELINNPGLKQFQLEEWRGPKGDAYYLASATLHLGDRRLFAISEPNAYLQVEFLRKGSTYDPALVDQIAGAVEAHVLGLTNENLSAALEAVLTRRTNSPLRKLRVVFASEQIARLIPAIDGVVVPHRLRRATGLKIIQHLRNSVGEKLAEDFEIRESFHPLPFVGVRTRTHEGDWNTRIGLCIPNRRNMDRPYIDVPAGRFGSAIGEAFDYFVNWSKAIPNRVVVGVVKKNDSGEVFLPTSLHDKALLSSLPEQHVEANVLIVVYRKFQRKDSDLLLQKRTKFNADDSLDKLSNLSARITESDCYKTSEGTLGADPHIADKDEAFDRVLQAAEIEEGGALPDWVYKNAAVRECYAGLGLLQEPEAFRDHGTRTLRLKGKSTQRFFKILSIGLDPNIYEGIAKSRPHANLSPVRISDIKDHPLNTFLQEHLEETFVPIFSELKLAK